MKIVYAQVQKTRPRQARHSSRTVSLLYISAHTSLQQYPPHTFTRVPSNMKWQTKQRVIGISRASVSDPARVAC